MSFTATAAPHPDDTIVAVSSAPGPGKRVIVRVSGPITRSVIESVFKASGGREPSVEGTNRGFTPPARRITRGNLALSGIHSPLPASLYIFAGPRSYTGQDLAEIHTIGSPPLVERLVSDLLFVGARAARPGEFTLRAFLAGKLDLPKAEAVNAVIEAGSDSDLAAAMSQLAGGVSQPLHSVRTDLLNLLADVEAALDFADEHIEFIGPLEALARLDSAIDCLKELSRRIADRTVSGRPVRVALVGEPNAGKSSLFNALSGSEALVCSTPGTTRDFLTRAIELGGIQIELLDTAGWLDSIDSIEADAQRLGREQSQQADLILWCDQHGTFAEVDAKRFQSPSREVLRVHTKSDLARDATVPSVAASVITSGGTDSLRTALAERVAALARPALAPNQSRCRHHLGACLDHLQAARDHSANADPPELVSAALRAALDQLGELTGAVFTDDLLDRIFSRFCIGK